MGSLLRSDAFKDIDIGSLEYAYWCSFKLLWMQSSVRKVALETGKVHILTFPIFISFDFKELFLWNSILVSMYSASCPTNSFLLVTMESYAIFCWHLLAFSDSCIKYFFLQNHSAKSNKLISYVFAVIQVKEITKMDDKEFGEGLTLLRGRYCWRVYLIALLDLY